MKINKETQALNDTLNKMDLIDIYRTFHLKKTEYTFFSSVHGTFSRIDHILGHKSSRGKFKKIEIISSIFSDHNTMKVDINYRKKTVKNTNTWRLNNTLLNNQEITEEIKEEIKKYLGFIAALFTIARTWKQPKCPSTDEWIKKMWLIYTMEYTTFCYPFIS